MPSIAFARGAIVAVALVIAGSAWSTDTASRCCSSRLRTSGQRERRIFRCHAQAAARGVAVDATCVSAAGDALERTFGRSGCVAPTDAGLVRADLERITASTAGLLRPTAAASTCAARKLKAAGRFVTATSRAFADEAPRPQDRLEEFGPAVDAIIADMRNAFTRLEAQGGCLTTNDADHIAALLLYGPYVFPADGVLLEALRLCSPSCGDLARGGAEECDGIDAFACNGYCQPDCTCPKCGNGVKDQTTEACDGADAAACQGLCQPDCTCPAPVCGNGVKESGEDCDGPGALGACGSSCNPDCTCGPAVCGNGVVEQGEQCEGTVCYDGPYPIAGCRPDSCTCCGYPCYQFGCCDPEETCMPSPSTGYCFKFTCNQSPTCNFGFVCVDSPTPTIPGKICAGLLGTTCFLPDFSGGIQLYCSPPGICQSQRCCLPAGESCSSGSVCCSGTCTAGTCD